MTPLLANSGPSRWVESLIAGPTILVAIFFGVSGIVFRYRPAALGGGVVALLVAVFWLFCSIRYNTPGAVRAAAFCCLVAIALIAFKRSPKK